ncbi:hypothetical protein LCGC14_1107430 [marine sediment metagenome]|uniref:Recombination endonuclease VII n=1 Tax=marine sediment metagenome TaxID=412755 RepID=A0A0F9MVL6_9ZZZZ
MTKCCRKCGETKSLSAFSKDKNRKDGYNCWCKDCRKNYVILWTNSCVSQRGSYLKAKYGLSIQDYNQIFNKQRGCCAICGRHQDEFKIALAVDHDHRTDVIRGLLCADCNRGIGFFRENRGCLMKAIQYLGRQKKE